MDVFEEDGAPEFDSGAGGPGAEDALARLRMGFSDVENGDRLAIGLRGDVVYVPGRGWGAWDGARFDFERGEIIALSRARILRQMIEDEGRVAKGEPVPKIAIAALAAETGVDPGTAEAKLRAERRAKYRDAAKACWSDGRLVKALKWAREQLMAAVDDFDAALGYVTAPNGDIDLEAVRAPVPEAEEPDEALARRAAWLVPHDRARLATRRLGVAFDPGAACPRWEWFVSIILPDPADRAYLRRVLGYMVDGGNRHQQAVLFLGEGGNGKSTVAEAVRAVMGDYAAAVKVEMFMEARSGGSEGASPSEARLPGARVYIASEPEQSQVLSSARVKGMTGGDRREARQLREAPFEWVPVGVPLLSMNRVPRIHDESGGLWRRIAPVVFPVRLAELQPADRRPPGWVKAMLAEEAAGILLWALEGLSDLAALERAAFDAANPLGATPAALTRKASMRASADPVGTFLGEMVQPAVGLSIQSTEMHGVFETWCEMNATEPLKIRTFKKVMEDKGYVAGKRNGGRVHWLHVHFAGTEDANAVLVEWAARKAHAGGEDGR